MKNYKQYREAVEKELFDTYGAEVAIEILQAEDDSDMIRDMFQLGEPELDAVASLYAEYLEFNGLNRKSLR